jgi:hypothetical protein
MIATARGGAPIAAGVDHDHYRHAIPAVSAATRLALIADLS